jgi:hypothetical protein
MEAKSVDPFESIRTLSEEEVEKKKQLQRGAAAEEKL